MICGKKIGVILDPICVYLPRVCGNREYFDKMKERFDIARMADEYNEFVFTPVLHEDLAKKQLQNERGAEAIVKDLVCHRHLYLEGLWTALERMGEQQWNKVDPTWMNKLEELQHTALEEDTKTRVKSFFLWNNNKTICTNKKT